MPLSVKKGHSSSELREALKTPVGLPAIPLSLAALTAGQAHDTLKAPNTPRGEVNSAPPAANRPFASYTPALPVNPIALKFITVDSAVKTVDPDINKTVP
jgi:hypothetical protein